MNKNILRKMFWFLDLDIKLVLGILIVGILFGIFGFLLFDYINYILETTDITGMPL